MATQSEVHSLIKVKPEPIDDLTIVIKTETEWKTEESSKGLSEYTNSASPDTLWEETRMYTPVKLEPEDIATEECEGGEAGKLDPLGTCVTGIKREVTEQIVSTVKVEPLDFSDCSSSLQIGEEEREEYSEDDRKNNVLVNIVPFVKQELDHNLHNILKGRSSEAAGSLSESVPEADCGEDSVGNSPESPRLVIAEGEDARSAEGGSERSVPRNLLGEGWRMTVFRCVHCMTLAWDVVRLARHDCGAPQRCESNGRILGRLRPGTQVKYVNTFGCQECGKLFFKRKNYRKHVSAMHSEEMLQGKVHSQGDSHDRPVSGTQKYSLGVQLRRDSCAMQSSAADSRSTRYGDETVAEESAVTGSSSSGAEDGNSLNICVVCSKESCQMHIYAVRGRLEDPEKTSVFTCRTCNRDFRCQENYWRHMYYHGFKTENMTERELSAISQRDIPVGAKKRARRPRKKSGSSQVEPSADASCQNAVPLSAAAPPADGCSSKIASQGEGTGGVGATTEVCFASVDECEIHNQSPVVLRSASKNNKRKISVESSITEDDEPEPRKRRCSPLVLEPSSPAAARGSVESEESSGCSLPQNSSGAIWPDNSPAGYTCGTVGASDVSERECPTEGEASDVEIDGVCRERLEKNEWSTDAAVIEVEKISIEDPNEEYKDCYSTASDTISAVTTSGEMCSSSSVQLMEGTDQAAIEVIDIEDDDASADKTSSFPESHLLDSDANCDKETAAVPVEENLERVSDSSIYTAEHDYCKPARTYMTSQNMEIDLTAEEEELGSSDSGDSGDRSPLTARDVTVADSCTPSVRAGTSVGAGVAVIKCVKGDTGESRQLTKLIFLPTVQRSENSGGTVGNVRNPSTLVLKVVSTPQTSTHLLKCQKCNLLATYGPAFFLHKCSPLTTGVNNCSGELSEDGARVAPKDEGGVSSTNSGGASCEARSGRGAAAGGDSAGPVLWKCLRCKFTTYCKDVFKLHSCESAGDAEVVEDGPPAGAETKRGTGAAPGPPTKYLWRCVGCSLCSNSRQCLLMHKCSSFKKKPSGPDAASASGPELMCCKCGFKTAGRLMFASHRCETYEPPPWLPRDKVPLKRIAPDTAKVCDKSPQKDASGSVHNSVLNFLLTHSGAKMVENNGSFLVMLPNMSTVGSPA